MYDLRDANYPVSIMGIDFNTLHNTGTSISCMSYAYYIRLKDPQALRSVPAVSVHSATGNDLHPVILMCCKIMIGKLQFRKNFHCGQEFTK